MRGNAEASGIPMASLAHHRGRIRKEAAMAAITFDAPHQAEPIKGRCNTAFSAQFQPLDPGVVNEAIPAFFIGRNREGFWVARHARGQIGGIFLLENSALSFARRHSQPAGCATIYPSGRFELDLPNQGNPLVVPLGSLLRISKRPRRQLPDFIAMTKASVKRRLQHFSPF
jgi:hypothetical protein